MRYGVVVVVLLFIFSTNLVGQNSCFTTDEAQRIIETIKNPPVLTENEQIRLELLEMQSQRKRLNDIISADFEKNQKLIPESNLMGEKHLLRVCQILKKNGWLRMKQIQEDGFLAFTFLITNNKAHQLQQEFLPILSEAAKHGYIAYPLLATTVDSIRIGLNLPQIFGTQATIKKDVIYLYPLLNGKKVDEWRKKYDLPPLAVNIKGMENSYFFPVLKMQRQNMAPNLKVNEKNNDIPLLGIFNEENEVLKIETKLVNLNVRVLTQDFKIPKELNLLKEDFTILEDDKEQEVSFFSTSEQPFDLILLLDFSASTKTNRGLIKKATQRFVEYARPNDRIAVVAFANEIKMVSKITTDKKLLIQEIKRLELEGLSPIWDSLKFTYENIINKESVGRRSAVVIMTDGEDNSKNTIFADLMETVRLGDTTIFPVYVEEKWLGNDLVKKNRRRSYQSLWLLAEESGGQLYKANEIKDLNGIYEQIINELGKVYSIGYQANDENRDGGWRNLKVKIKNQPNLIAKTRLGYYAN